MTVDKEWDGKMVQQLKMLATKPDDLRLGSWGPTGWKEKTNFYK